MRKETKVVDCRLRVSVIIAAVCLFIRTVWGLPAFPGAEGFGSQTPGGRGGRVIEVTTLDDSGPGSLREAVTAEGPRTIVFRVGGTIRLKSHLRVTEPFVTIAGQTAPGSGILLRDAGFYIQTHDVVVRFVRSRVGPSLVEPYDTQDSLQISGQDAHDIVIDHCSFSWSIDECVGIRAPAHDVTFSWNIVSEALRQPFTKEQIGKDRSHSMALILSGGPTRCSLHHNLLALCNSRNPRIQGGRHAFINNVVYGWGWLTGTFSRDPEVNFIGNYYKPGPGSQTLKAICEQPGQMGRIHVRGNRSPDRPDDAMPEWEPTVNASADEHQAVEAFETASVTAISADEAYAAVLRSVGAALPARDAVDARIVRNVRLSMGEKIDRPEQVGGYPEVVSGPAPRDTDHDGMPDDWEMAHGFGLTDAGDAIGDADGDGYTNLEEYLQSLVDEGLTPRPEVRGISIDRPGGPFTVRSEASQLPIVRVGGDQRSFYAHAWFQDEVRLEVSSRSAGRVDSAHPPRIQDRVKVSGTGIELYVAEEGARVFDQGADGNRLFAFFDSYPQDSLQLDDDNVIDAGRYGIVGNRDNVTHKLQAALDAAAKVPGGVVFIPSGDLEIDTVRVPTGVTLYLAVSSVLYSSGKSADGAMILFDGVENAGLSGPGVIDGRGDEGLPSAAAVAVRNARTIVLKDLMVRNPSGPGIEITDSRDVKISRSKILAVGERQGIGGLHFNRCESVICERSFISGTGIGISIQASGSGGAVGRTRAISVHEATVLSTGRGISIGPHSDQPIQDVVVRDSDLICRGQGISVVARHGAGGIENLVFKDLTLDVQSLSGDPESGRPFLVLNQSEGPLKNLLFERVRTSAWVTSEIVSSGSRPIEDVRFWGVEITAGPIDNSEPRPLFHLRQVRRPQFRFLEVSWPPNKTVCWTGLFQFDDVREVVAPANEILEKTLR
ncbi:MAG: glycosyl hydrolase family 28 protein [Phycisphaerae bacterium]|nr:glycosyl hydrolase family 28 protein [Phycisphaerae bacterium]